ncbi:hypothetical protein GALMADRAFT_142679 [Galerina marginata CBS 339.88]|uniref:Uncharacterized protein n=1 Tax=Galerina marginata (strain CBS 339.88) TaxID=685588 RepID=A0A067SSI4_GALM3|nr:hypothetical protein GALMADRAFT_142679 [Galerina marginata CBS 339.88]
MAAFIDSMALPSFLNPSRSSGATKDQGKGIISMIRSLVSSLSTYQTVTGLLQENVNRDMAVAQSIQSIVSTSNDCPSTSTTNQSPSQGVWRSYEVEPLLPPRLEAPQASTSTPICFPPHLPAPAIKVEPCSPSIKLEQSDDESRAVLKREFDSGYESNADSSDSATRSPKRRRSEDLPDIKPKIEDLSDSETNRRRPTRRTRASNSRHGRNPPPSQTHRHRKPMLPYNLKPSGKLQRTYAFVEYDIGNYVAWLPDHPSPRSSASPRSDAASYGSPNPQDDEDRDEDMAAPDFDDNDVNLNNDDDDGMSALSPALASGLPFYEYYVLGLTRLNVLRMTIDGLDHPNTVQDDIDMSWAWDWGLDQEHELFTTAAASSSVTTTAAAPVASNARPLRPTFAPADSAATRTAAPLPPAAGNALALPGPSGQAAVRTRRTRADDGYSPLAPSFRPSGHRG